MQVLSAIRGAQLAHYLDPNTVQPVKQIVKDPTKPTELSFNKEYESWYAEDQQIFNYLTSYVSKEVLVQLSTCTTSAEIWKTILDMTASKSRGRIINTQMALATAQKGISTIAEYFGKIKSLADDMASAGKRLEDEEVASYILAGLDAEYNPVVSSVSSCISNLTLAKLYTQLVSWEQRINLQNSDNSGSSANSATHSGRGGFNRGGGHGRGRGRGRGNDGNNGGNGGRPRQNSNEVCQLCNIPGHTVLRCCKRFDTSFNGPYEKRSTSSTSTNSYGVDMNWYTDTGATDHITGELEKLTVRDKYLGND